MEVEHKEDVLVKLSDIESVNFFNIKKNGAWLTFTYLHVKDKSPLAEIMDKDSIFLNFKATRHFLGLLGFSFRRFKRDHDVEKRNEKLMKAIENAGDEEIICKVGTDDTGRLLVHDVVRDDKGK